MKTTSMYPTIVTGKIDDTIDFYCNVMDYSVKHRLNPPHGGQIVVLENPKGFQIELIEMAEGAPITANEGLYGIRINVDSIDEAKDELIGKGCQILGGPFDTPTSKNMMISDPNGINITLIEHKKH